MWLRSLPFAILAILSTLGLGWAGDSPVYEKILSRRMRVVVEDLTGTALQVTPRVTGWGDPKGPDARVMALVEYARAEEAGQEQRHVLAAWVVVPLGKEHPYSSIPPFKVHAIEPHESGYLVLLNLPGRLELGKVEKKEPKGNWFLEVSSWEVPPGWDQPRIVLQAQLLLVKDSVYVLLDATRSVELLEIKEGKMSSVWTKNKPWDPGPKKPREPGSGFDSDFQGYNSDDRPWGRDLGPKE